MLLQFDTTTTNVADTDLDPTYLLWNIKIRLINFFELLINTTSDGTKIQRKHQHQQCAGKIYIIEFLNCIH
jgi:hypothetical protein